MSLARFKSSDAGRDRGNVHVRRVRLDGADDGFVVQVFFRDSREAGGESEEWQAGLEGFREVARRYSALYPEYQMFENHQAPHPGWLRHRIPYASLLRPDFETPLAALIPSEKAERDEWLRDKIPTLISALLHLERPHGRLRSSEIWVDTRGGKDNRLFLPDYPFFTDPRDLLSDRRQLGLLIYQTIAGDYEGEVREAKLDDPAWAAVATRKVDWKEVCRLLSAPDVNTAIQGVLKNARGATRDILASVLRLPVSSPPVPPPVRPLPDAPPPPLPPKVDLSVPKQRAADELRLADSAGFAVIASSDQITRWVEEARRAVSLSQQEEASGTSEIEAAIQDAEGKTTRLEAQQKETLGILERLRSSIQKAAIALPEPAPTRGTGQGSDPAASALQVLLEKARQVESSLVATEAGVLAGVAERVGHCARELKDFAAGPGIPRAFEGLDNIPTQSEALRREAEEALRKVRTETQEISRLEPTSGGAMAAAEQRLERAVAARLSVETKCAGLRDLEHKAESIRDEAVLHLERSRERREGSLAHMEQMASALADLDSELLKWDAECRLGLQLAQQLLDKASALQQQPAELGSRYARECARTAAEAETMVAHLRSELDAARRSARGTRELLEKVAESLQLKRQENIDPAPLQERVRSAAERSQGLQGKTLNLLSKAREDVRKRTKVQESVRQAWGIDLPTDPAEQECLLRLEAGSGMLQTLGAKSGSALEAFAAKSASSAEEATQAGQELNSLTSALGELRRHEARLGEIGTAAESLVQIAHASSRLAQDHASRAGLVEGAERHHAASSAGAAASEAASALSQLKSLVDQFAELQEALAALANPWQGRASAPKTPDRPAEFGELARAVEDTGESVLREARKFEDTYNRLQRAVARGVVQALQIESKALRETTAVVREAHQMALGALERLGKVHKATSKLSPSITQLVVRQEALQGAAVEKRQMLQERWKRALNAQKELDGSISESRTQLAPLCRSTPRAHQLVERLDATLGSLQAAVSGVDTSARGVLSHLDALDRRLAGLSVDLHDLHERSSWVLDGHSVLEAVCQGAAGQQKSLEIYAGERVAAQAAATKLSEWLARNSAADTSEVSRLLASIPSGFPSTVTDCRLGARQLRESAQAAVQRAEQAEREEPAIQAALPQAAEGVQAAESLLREVEREDEALAQAASESDAAGSDANAVLEDARRFLGEVSRKSRLRVLATSLAVGCVTAVLIYAAGLHIATPSTRRVTIEELGSTQVMVQVRSVWPATIIWKDSHSSNPLSVTNRGVFSIPGDPERNGSQLTWTVKTPWRTSSGTIDVAVVRGNVPSLQPFASRKIDETEELERPEVRFQAGQQGVSSSWYTLEGTNEVPFPLERFGRRVGDLVDPDATNLILVCRASNVFGSGTPQRFTNHIATSVFQGASTNEVREVQWLQSVVLAAPAPWAIRGTRFQWSDARPLAGETNANLTFLAERPGALPTRRKLTATRRGVSAEVDYELKPKQRILTLSSSVESPTPENDVTLSADVAPSLINPPAPLVLHWLWTSNDVPLSIRTSRLEVRHPTEGDYTYAVRATNHFETLTARITLRVRDNSPPPQFWEGGSALTNGTLSLRAGTNTIYIDRTAVSGLLPVRIPLSGGKGQLTVKQRSAPGPFSAAEPVVDGRFDLRVPQADEVRQLAVCLLRGDPLATNTYTLAFGRPPRLDNRRDWSGELREGERFAWTPQISGSETIQAAWLGRPSSQGPVLGIPSPGPDDVTNHVLVAFNPWGTNSYTLAITNLAVKAPSIRLVGDLANATDPLKVRAGAAIAVELDSGASFPRSVDWLVNDKTVTNAVRLQYTMTRDAERVTIAAQRTVGTARSFKSPLSNLIRLELGRPPGPPQIRTPAGELAHGEVMRLETAATPDGALTWFVNDQELVAAQTELALTNNSPQLTNIVLQARVANAFGASTGKVQISVKPRPPEIDRPSDFTEDIQLEEGGSHSLAFVPRYHSGLVWLHNNQVLANATSPTIQVRAAGRYELMATNIAGAKTVGFRVTIRRAPKMIVVGSETMKMVPVPAADGGTLWVAAHEVSNALWREVTGAPTTAALQNPPKILGLADELASSMREPGRPVVAVTSEEIRSFLRNLNQKFRASTGLTFRLPTQTEWLRAYDYAYPNPRVLPLGQLVRRLPPLEVSDPTGEDSSGLWFLFGNATELTARAGRDGEPVLNVKMGASMPWSAPTNSFKFNRNPSSLDAVRDVYDGNEATGQKDAGFRVFATE